MQTTALTPTLAGLADWLPVIIIIVTVIASWVSTAMKEGGKKQRQRQRPRPTVDPNALQDETPTMGRRLSVDEMAARRREQLQELARRRQRAMGQGQPTNLTAGQVEERTRAKATYEARAQELRRAAEAQARRQQELEQARIRREREAQARSQRERVRGQREAQRRAQLQAQQRAQAAQRQQAQAAAARRSRLGAGVVQGVAHPTEDHDIGESVVHRQVSDAEMPVEVTTVPLLFGKPLNRLSLREAFVLKELLDKPVALRDPLSGVETI